jgi:hypothetical protein
MAINYLNHVNLNRNELQDAYLINPQIENQPNDAAAGTGYEGQLYFDTTVDALKIWAGGAWVEVGATSGVETFTNSSGTYVAFGTNNASAIGNVTVGTVDLTAIDGTSTAADRFLTKNNKWATIPFGDITAVLPGTYININNSTGPEPTVNHDLTTRTDTTSAASPGYGVSFTAVDSVTTNSTGHVTALNLKTVTLPAADDTNTTYTLPTSVGGTNSAVVTLTPGGSGGGGGSVTISGTSGEIAVTETAGANGTVFIGLPDDVTITSDLTVGDNLTLTSGNLSVTGTGSFTGEVTVPTATVGTSAPTLAQVQSLIAGVGVFQGSYNAATNTPALEGASNVALDQGDYFVVSVSGSFLGEALEPGDFIFANNAIAANSSPTLSDYTVVQADDNVAGTGATDGATQKGVSGFDSTHFTATSNGWIQLKPQANANGALVSLNNTAPSTRVEAGGLTTFTVDVTNAAVFGAGALGERVKVEVTEGAAPFQTVYADVTRSGSGTLSVIFTGSVAIDAYQVLLTYV